MKLSQVEWVPVGKAAIKEYSNDDVSGMAAEMAYHFIFALFPFVIFLAALAGFVGRIVGQGELFTNIMDMLYKAVPTAADALRGPLSEVLNNQRGSALSIGALLALLSASNAVSTIMKAFNRAYGVEETRNFIVTKAIAMGLTLALSIFMIGGFVLILFGGKIGEWLASQFGFGAVFNVVWTVLRFVLALVGITAALAVLYWKGPNVDQQFQWLTPGSIVTTVVWVVATGLFGLYVKFLGQSSYSKTYGTVWGLILFLLYLYLTSTVILMGAEVNAETTKRYDPDTIRDKITDPRKQLPGKQPQPHPQAAAEAGVSRGQIAESNTRSAQKLASGQGSPATATAATRASDSNGAATTPAPKDFSDPAVEERLRAIRQRPAPAHEAAARARVTSLSARERAERSRRALVAFAVSVITALGSVVFGTVRRRPN